MLCLLRILLYDLELAERSGSLNQPRGTYNTLSEETLTRHNFLLFYCMLFGISIQDTLVLIVKQLW